MKKPLLVPNRSTDLLKVLETYRHTWITEVFLDSLKSRIPKSHYSSSGP